MCTTQFYQRSAGATYPRFRLYAYPKKQQSSDRQLADENRCYASAKKQTGVDPQALAAAPPAQAQPAPAPAGSGARGAARGAAGGAAIRAITGNAGTGAAVGAAVGAVRGRQHGRHAQAQAQRQATAQAEQAHAQTMDSFKRPFSACMESRGYSIE